MGARRVISRKNEAESEVGRYKEFIKVKYSWVRTSNGSSNDAKDVHLQRHIAEYMFYTNVGRGIGDIMKAYRHASGIKGKAVFP